MLKIQGRSLTNEFVECYMCHKKYVWLRAEPDGEVNGQYHAICAKCRKESMKKPKKVGQCNECGKDVFEPFDDYCEKCILDDMAGTYDSKTGGYVHGKTKRD
jgi:hypothetical protein